MPVPLSSTPVLALAMDNLQKISNLDSDNLGSMWTVFTKCKENLEHGRRLENISWRLWYRETMLQEQRVSKRLPIANTPVPSSTADDLSNDETCQSQLLLPSSIEQQQQQQQPIAPIAENPATRQFSTFSFRKIISSLYPVGAYANDWKSLKDIGQMEAASSAPTVSVSAPVPAPVVEVNTGSLPDMRSISSASLVQETEDYIPCENNNSIRKSFTHVDKHNAISRCVSRKFFVDSDESDEEESATPVANKFALRLKRDSLPRQNGFYNIRHKYNFGGDEEDDDEEEEEEDYEVEDEDHSTFAKKTPHVVTAERSLLSSLLAARASIGSQPSQTYLRSSRSVYKDLHSISDNSHSQVKPQLVPQTQKNYVAPIRSPATIRRDILCTELSESLRLNMLWERQQRLWGLPRMPKVRGSISKSSVAEPVVAKTLVESFRGW